MVHGRPVQRAVGEVAAGDHIAGLDQPGLLGRRARAAGAAHAEAVAEALADLQRDAEVAVAAAAADALRHDAGRARAMGAHVADVGEVDLA